ncbi:amidohydrolase family protein [Dermatobacter hominis]|uniref:amidohydrolase family protein n=1 Tax=Dermatobacter hominis TaxID=2884263 RepID=UPI001D101B47|nr:amidohydrolase family protein [Dermatobacter hominis]UDY36623.1 amidohydrolase family protein [Dermatobacter hominis]
MTDGAPTVLFRDVEVEGRRADVAVRGGTVADVAPSLRPGPTDEVVEGRGGALLPGLHDHHIHLAALAAAMASVDVGPPSVVTAEQFADALAAADRRLPPGEWIRAVGYHESVAGPLDRRVLDHLVRDRPVRVQDRTGVRWTLNTAALERVGAHAAPHPGVARDADGYPTGVVDRADDWLGRAIGGGFPDLTAVGRRLAELGVTGVTDCTPYGDPTGPGALAEAVATGQLPQAVHLTGGVELADLPAPAPLEAGPVKVVLDEHDLGDLDAVVGAFASAHAAGRPVAVHVVTATTLAVALAAWDVAGTLPGDRVEHGSVITPAAAARVAALGVTVVTQPAFVAERGDRYVRDVDPDDVPHLYRCASLQRLGVPVAGSSDAPYTDPDPWRAVQAAVDRQTRDGHVLGPDERLAPDRALALFTGHPDDPGRRPRRVVAGAPADLCLLHRPLRGAAGVPTAADVRATYRSGTPI